MQRLLATAPPGDPWQVGADLPWAQARSANQRVHPHDAAKKGSRSPLRYRWVGIWSATHLRSGLAVARAQRARDPAAELVPQVGAGANARMAGRSEPRRRRSGRAWLRMFDGLFWICQESGQVSPSAGAELHSV